MTLKYRRLSSDGDALMPGAADSKPISSSKHSASQCTAGRQGRPHHRSYSNSAAHLALSATAASPVATSKITTGKLHVKYRSVPPVLLARYLDDAPRQLCYLTSCSHGRAVPPRGYLKLCSRQTTAEHTIRAKRNVRPHPYTLIVRM